MTASQIRISPEATSLNTRHAMGFAPADDTPIRRHAKNPLHRRFAQYWALLLACIAVALACPAAHAANQFAPVPALNFSKLFDSANPLSQTITVTSTGTAFNFTATVSTDLGGSWLSISPSNFGFGVSTPYGITVVVNPVVTLAPGPYTGHINLISPGVTPMSIPVTLVIHAATDTYFDQIAGGLSFSLASENNTPPAQALQVRNAGAGSLSWTATTSTADGGSWLTLSSTSGTAPSNLSVGVTVANLPGAGVTAGTFIGQVVFQTAGDTVTVPVAVKVGASVLAQVNPLNFAKAFTGPNPLSQEITIASTNAAITFTAKTQDSTGGSWLTINPSNYGFGVSTPYNITVGVNPAVTLAAGTYMAEIIVTETNGQDTLTIPVTMTVYPAAATYFDNVTGSVNFSMATKGEAPPAQDILIKGVGASALNWTATVTTADGGDWLSVSSASGSAPSIVSVSVNPANVLNAGLQPGTFIGQIALSSQGSRITIPISFTIGDAVFRQVHPLNFTKVFGGPNPLSQVFTVASTGTNFTFNAVVVNGTGGNWLTINPANYGFGINTPLPIEVSVNPAVTVTAGIYKAEIILTSEGGAQALTIPVTLTITAPTDTFFDALPGQMTFTMATGGMAPPPQVLPIRNGGQGTLDWTATVTTSDGGNWLSISAESGTAPSEPTVSVNPANIPQGGLVAGTFTGLISLEENGHQISVPVSFVVGANVFQQISPLNFTMIQGGANPLPQVVTVGSSGTDFTFLASVSSSTGGAWLSINPSNYGFGISTPQAVTASVNVPITTTAGTYSSEIVLHSADNTQGLVVPVTLTVEPGTATFFDSLPGQLTFSMLTSGGSTPSNPPPAQTLAIRNAGSGSLPWTATVTTSDGGAWLSISASSGTAPSFPTVSVNPANIQNAGLLPGTFTGQVILETPGNRVTIPVTFVVGASVFRQVNALNFNKVFAGPNPLPQLISITSTGAAISSLATAVSSTGGSWLQITPVNYGFGINTTIQMVVTANPALTLAAGIYTSEIVLKTSSGTESMVIPVTLTVNAANSTFFNDMQGAATFFVQTGGANPPAQSIPIRNAGTGTLHWTATATTSDGGNWLNISSASGTAPDSISISVNAANLPNSALLAGQFSGEVVLASGTGRQSIPVAVVVGTNLFAPPPALAFSKPFGGANPGFKLMTISSTGTNFNFVGQAASATGGNWLTITPSNFGFGVATPFGVQVSANPVVTLAAGTYIGETIYISTDNTQGLVVPVSLTVYSVPAPTPKLSLAAGAHTGPQKLTITDSLVGAQIYYSTNGKIPTNASTKYTGPIKVSVSEKVMAIAYGTGYLPSAVATAAYTIIAETPKISPKGGVFVSSESVSIVDGTAGAEIFYTTNGKKPSKSSTRYTKPFAITKNATVMAVAFAPGVNESAVASAKFNIRAAAPKILPPSGIFSKAISVTMTDATKGAVIYYTTNGSTPTTASAHYTKAITVSSKKTIKAMALAPGGTESTITTATYTFKK